MRPLIVFIAALAVMAAASTAGFLAAERQDREKARSVNLEWRVTHYPPHGEPVVYDVHYDANRSHSDGSVSWMHYAGYRMRIRGEYTVEPRYAD